MIALRSEKEIAVLREANQIVAEVLVAMAGAVAPGVTTRELDAFAVDLIREHGARPSFLGYHGYPSSTCISVEEVIIHGIPGKRRIRNGEIVGSDVGVLHHGYHGDAAITVACGKVDKLRQRLMATTDRALACGIAAARPGNRLQDVSRAVQTTVEDQGFSVVRNFVGHGIGTEMHEEPQIPNFVSDDPGPRLRPGMVLAIEPMVNAGRADVKILKDDWTAVTADGKPSAHFEHSIVVRDGVPELLSATPALVWGRQEDEAPALRGQ